MDAAAPVAASVVYKCKLATSAFATYIARWQFDDFGQPAAVLLDQRPDRQSADRTAAVGVATAAVRPDHGGPCHEYRRRRQSWRAAT